MHRGKQCYMCLSLVPTCSVIPDSYGFQSTFNLVLAGYITSLCIDYVISVLAFIPASSSGPAAK